MPEIISRKEARALGLKRYFSGKSCAAGHVTWCYVKGGCVACTRERSRLWEGRHPEEHRAAVAARGKKYREQNWERVKQLKRRLRAKNLEKYREEGRLRYKQNPGYRRTTLEYQRKVRAAYRALKELGIEI